MEMLTAVALLFCRTWPCQVLITSVVAGAAAGGIAGYLLVKQYVTKTRV